MLPARESRQELRELAYTDQLTGLPNRAGLVRELDQEITEHAGDFGLAIVDLDGLKEANDKRGHAAGDLMLRNTGVVLEASTPERAPEDAGVLRAVAAALLDTMRIKSKGERRADYVARGRRSAFRMGGDEFVMILSGANTQHKVDNALKRATDALAEEGIEASMGGLPHNGETGIELLAAVDQKMYQQKQARKAARRQERVRALPLLKRLAYMGDQALKHYHGIEDPRR